MSTIVIASGASIQAAINGNPAGTVFQLSAGVYRDQHFLAQNGDQFLGDPNGGTVLSGAIVLGQWSVSGGYWKASGLPAPLVDSGDTGSNPLANHDNDLFVDKTLFQRVSSLSQMTTGKWFFDPATNSAYISDNPVGHTVEYSVTPNMTYDNGATDVVVKNLTIEKYATAAQIGPIHGVRDWNIVDVTSRWNHGAGLNVGAGTVVQGGHYNNNGQEGIAGYRADGAQILSAEIASNNYAGYNSDWDAGGVRIFTSANVVVSNNNVHYNNGMGIWADIDCSGWTISGNTVTNNAGNGIMYEVSHGNTVIENNTVSGSSRAAIYISNSDGVVARDNTVTVGAGNTSINGGIDMINVDRGSGPNGVYHLINNSIQGNTIVHINDTATDGIFVYQSLPGQPNNTLNNNTYYVPSVTGTYWHFGSTDYTWSSLHQNTAYESSGTESIGLPTQPPVLPPITFGTGPDSLVLEVCDDAYANGDGTSNANGDATFTISIDGKQIGGTFTTIASHAAGQDQDLTLNGYFGPGTHSVSVNFLNDAYNNTPSTDRNLYVDSVTYKGVNTNQAGQLLSAGAQGFTVSGGTSEPPPIQPITFGTGPDSLVIEVCDDAYANGGGTSNANGDATFTVSIDGKQIGGTFTTTASHAAGQDQDLTLNGYFGPGTHSVSVNFLNDAYNNTPSTDRNLYVDSVTYKGVNTNQAGQFLSAGAQAFTVSGGTSVNTVTGGPGNDTLNGGVGNDTLTGLGGNDILNGGAGADTMVGGAGNDIYFVDNAADVVNEAAGGGNDDILTKINYVLAAGTEVEGLRANAGATGLTLTGNEFNNILVGNVGNDTLLGGAGNDAINGGVGADTMAGGIGNDTYFVDNAADVVNETAGQGTDTVMASVNYALTAGSEIEFLRANAGASGLSLTGNALVNRLVGGAGNDTLNGGAGNDSLGGGAGNDVFKFLAGFGQDTITDFAAGPAGSQDLIDISGLGITAATFAANVHTANGGGGSTMVSFGGSANSIRLLNVAPANFDVTDCKLA